MVPLQKTGAYVLCHRKLPGYALLSECPAGYRKD